MRAFSRPSKYRSWGRYPPADHEVRFIRWRHEALPQTESTSMLPFGNGRSYGDSCLNDGALLLDVRGLDRLISFDVEHGVIRCEAGVLLSDILDLIVPRGWFVPVSPGTKFVTVGGAIANDVHGKNHHRAGSFGCHVRQFELLRSDGSRRRCSRSENPDWFAATIGGLGLTGVILWAELELKQVAGAAMDIETMRFPNLSEFFRLTDESDATFDYTVAWVDCASRGKRLGTGDLHPRQSLEQCTGVVACSGGWSGRPDRATRCAGQQCGRACVQRLVLPPAPNAIPRGSLRLFLLSARSNSQLESHLWSARLSPVSMCSRVGRRAGRNSGIAVPDRCRPGEARSWRCSRSSARSSRRVFSPFHGRESRSHWIFQIAD